MEVVLSVEETKALNDAMRAVALTHMTVSAAARRRSDFQKTGDKVNGVIQGACRDALSAGRGATLSWELCRTAAEGVAFLADTCKDPEVERLYMAFADLLLGRAETAKAGQPTSASPGRRG